MVRYDERRAVIVPDRFTFTAESQHVTAYGVIEVLKTGDAPLDAASMHPAVTELTLVARGGITTDVLRALPLGDVLEEAVLKAGWPVVLMDDGRWDLFGGSDAAMDRRVARRAVARRGSPVTRSDLHEAVRAYRAAAEQGRTDRLEAVREACHVSTATAWRRLEAAVKAGLIADEELMRKPRRKKEN